MFLKAELVEPADEIRCEVSGRRSDAPLVGVQGVEPRRPALVHTASRYTRPVPLDLLTQAAEGADDADEQWRCLRWRLRRPPPPRGPTIRELQQAYEEGTGTLLGCD